jgi:hypothetical protein
MWGIYAASGEREARWVTIGAEELFRKLPRIGAETAVAGRERWTTRAVTRS